jgi:hypothetical protein
MRSTRSTRGRSAASAAIALAPADQPRSRSAGSFCPQIAGARARAFSTTPRSTVLQVVSNSNPGIVGFPERTTAPTPRSTRNAASFWYLFA